MNRDILKKFKNQFHLVKKAVEDMSQRNIGLKLNYEKDKGITTFLNLPPEKEIARFATVFKPMTDPASPLYFKKISSTIIENNLVDMSNTEKEDLQKRIQRIETGSFRFVFNEKPFSATDLYLLYSNGEYFSEDEAAAKRLKTLKTTPVIPPFLLFQFYSYLYDAYSICQYLYYLIRCDEKAIGTGKISSSINHGSNQCIYCLTKDGKFKTEEHVYPESLGNTEIILPPGYVCDECNNGVLSELDDYFVNHDMIAFLRTWYVPYNPKTGKFSQAKYQNLRVERTHPRKVNLIIQSGSKKEFDVKDIDNGLSSIKFTARGRVPFDPKHLGRALYKIALGIICWKNGLEVALDKKYDLARNYVLEKSSFPNNLFISTKCEPCEYIAGEHIIESTGTFFMMNIFGVVFLFNLEPEPLMTTNKEIERLNFACYSLSD